MFLLWLLYDYDFLTEHKTNTLYQGFRDNSNSLVVLMTSWLIADISCSVVLFASSSPFVVHVALCFGYQASSGDSGAKGAKGEPGATGSVSVNDIENILPMFTEKVSC